MYGKPQTPERPRSGRGVDHDGERWPLGQGGFGGRAAGVRWLGCLLAGGEQAESGSGLGSGSEGSRVARHFSDPAFNGCGRVLTSKEKCFVVRSLAFLDLALYLILFPAPQPIPVSHDPLELIYIYASYPIV